MNKCTCLRGSPCSTVLIEVNVSMFRQVKQIILWSLNIENIYNIFVMLSIGGSVKKKKSSMAKI